MVSLKQNINNLPNAFIKIKKYLLLPSAFPLTSTPYLETESHDYGAMRFQLAGKSIIFRQAKTTPNKQGQFVTLWKRPTPDSEIMPFEKNDDIDFCLIATFSEHQKGIFLFDSHVLIKQGIFSSQTKTGKRAIRVYPTWVFPTSRQALQTQKWQSSYFINFDKQETAIEKFKNIFLNYNHTYNN
ncbi:MepB family protein [Xenorhabdus griffiniae]|uniref:MepB family protein n=1 Tax=Xenorhabdus griffiniae TaxID=351672 RepID=A0ABY9XFE1_9GAMM|nr:MepB family protein [Xenorhabdus griffiniae]WMV71609.1 MepB family protein [Xenorhabdus griffiniae]WNH01286.1 MepB family protein [Xenorhabdus griffiniae]